MVDFDVRHDTIRIEKKNRFDPLPPLETGKIFNSKGTEWYIDLLRTEVADSENEVNFSNEPVFSSLTTSWPILRYRLVDVWNFFFLEKINHWKTLFELESQT